jgi:hypothetical protein
MTDDSPAVRKWAFGARLVWFYRRHLTYATSCRTCSSHSLHVRLAIMAPSGPAIIDSVRCSRLTLSALKPRLLILGSQSWLVGSHYWHRAVAWWMTALMRADGGMAGPSDNW